MRQIPGIYDLTEGCNICVKTDENRFSMLTITKRASAATGTIDFHYTTWNQTARKPGPFAWLAYRRLRGPYSPHDA